MGVIVVSYQANNGINQTYCGVNMMDILNTTTGEVVTIKLIDPATGVNMVADYSQIQDDQGVVYNDETEQYEADNNTIEWWQNSLSQYQEMEQSVYDIKKYGTSEQRKVLEEILEDNRYQEWNDRAGYILQEISEKIGNA